MVALARVFAGGSFPATRAVQDFMASDAADAGKSRIVRIVRMTVGRRLHHAYQAVAGQCGIHHVDIALLEDVQRQPAAQFRQQSCDAIGTEQAGRAAADENAGNRARPGKRAHMGDFTQETGDEAFLVDRLVADMAVEVAIGAFGRAERPVQIDAETRLAVIAIDA